MSSIQCWLERSSSGIRALISTEKQDGEFLWYRCAAAAGLQLIQSDLLSHSSSSEIVYVPTLDDWGATIFCRFAPRQDSISGSNFAEIKIPPTNASVLKLCRKLQSNGSVQLKGEDDSFIGFVNETQWRLTRTQESVEHQITAQSTISLKPRSTIAEIVTSTEDQIAADFMRLHERDAFALVFRKAADNLRGRQTGQSTDPDPGAYDEILTQTHILSALNLALNDEKTQLKTLYQKESASNLEAQSQIRWLEAQLTEKDHEILQLQNVNIQLEQGLRSLAETSGLRQAPPPPFLSAKNEDAQGENATRIEGEVSELEYKHKLTEEHNKLVKQKQSLLKRESRLQKEYAEFYLKQAEVDEMSRQIEIIRVDRDRLKQELLIAEEEIAKKSMEDSSESSANDGYELRLLPLLRHCATSTDDMTPGLPAACTLCNQHADDIERVKDDNNELVQQNNSLRKKCESLQNELDRMRRSSKNTLRDEGHQETVGSNGNRVDFVQGKPPMKDRLSQIVTWKRCHLKERRLDMNDNLRSIAIRLSEAICEKDEQIRALQTTLQALAQGEPLRNKRDPNY